MLSGTYLDSEAADRLNALKDAFAKHSDYVDQESGATVISAPFRSMVLPNLVQESVRLEEIRSLILSSTEFFHKSNDLYEFFQSNDLKHSAHAQIQKLISQLFSPAWISLMSHLTGIKLSATVDISCQKYPPGGYLLCHDDDMGEDEDSRRIAFILYLVEPDWNAQQDGGHLQLYTT